MSDPRHATSDGNQALLWMHEYLPRLRAFVRSRLPSDLRRRESDSDVVQSICRELIAHSPVFVDRGETCFRGWLFKTASNKVREKLRFHRQRRRDVRREDATDMTDPGVEAPNPADAAMAREHLGRLARAIDRLEPADREVVTLARLASLPLPMVAERIGKTEAAARKQLGRALIRLAALLRDDGRSDPETTDR